MTIEEVIAIAKTLRPWRTFIGAYEGHYKYLEWDNRRYAYRGTWLQALIKAGWKG